MDYYDQRWVARLFRKPEWAITLGQNTFYSVPAFMVNGRWRSHENIHKRQWRDEGVLKFICKYLYYHWKFGYWGNPYEREARDGSTW